MTSPHLRRPSSKPRLLDLQRQRAELDQLLYATWLQEREEARRRIVALAQEYQIPARTASTDIEAANRTAPPGDAAFQAPRVEVPLRMQDRPRHVAPRYRDSATGETWSGRGNQPRWLRSAIEAGRALEDFAVDQDGGEASTSDPLLQFQDAAKRTRRRPPRG